MSGRDVVVALAAMLLTAPFLLVGLGQAPFDDPGEGMHAEIARELLASRDPLALSLNGVRYVDKPPLLYVILASAFTLAGRSEAVARAVPAVAALLAIGATAWLGRRLLGAGGGVVAGVALGTSVGFFAYGRYVRPESLFVAALALGFAAMLRGVMDGRRGLVMLGLAAFGAAALAKDPLGALAPPLAVGVALALCGRARPLARWLPPAGILAWALLGFGWWILAESRTRGFTWYTVVDNHVLNVLSARRFPDEDVGLTAIQFLVVAVAGAAPWALAAAATVISLARRRAWRDPSEMAWTALTLWVIGVLAATALSQFRLPHYGLPAYPALALLAARGWREHGGRGLVALHALLFAAIAVACALAWRGDPDRLLQTVVGVTDVATRKLAAAGQTPSLVAGDALRPLLGATAIAFAAGAALTAGLLARRRGSVVSSRVAVVAVSATMLAVLPAVAAALSRVSAHRAVRGVAVEVARRAGPDDVVAHEGPLENSGAFEWYSDRRPVIVNGRRSVLGFGATRREAAGTFWEGDELRRAWEGDRRVWLVTTRDPQRSLTASLPGARLVTASGGRWLYVNR